MEDDFDDQTGLPTTNKDQLCAFCGQTPRFAHALDPAHVRFRFFGKGYTLPTFWTVCERCEHLVSSGNDDALLRHMIREQEDADLEQASLAAFRAADLGATRLDDA
jgi:hypothetical protein